MKQYYLKDGTRERGPYLIDDLKYQRLRHDTLVKVDNGKWQPISEVTDLSFLLNDNDGANAYSSAKTTAQSHTHLNSLTPEQQMKKRVTMTIALAIAMAILGMLGSLFFFMNSPK